MKNIDSFNYSNDGITITFKETPISQYAVVKMYSFSIIGDEEMTKKLRDSVKKKEVFFKAIPLCAAALFEIIKEGKFIKLYTREELETLIDDFGDIFGNPWFAIGEFTTSPSKPWFKVVLRNSNPMFLGEGRTVDQAKAEALVAYFQYYKVYN